MKRTDIVAVCLFPLLLMLGMLQWLPGVLALLMTLLIVMPFILVWLILDIYRDQRYSPYT